MLDKLKPLKSPCISVEYVICGYGASLWRKLRWITFHVRLGSQVSFDHSNYFHHSNFQSIIQSHRHAHHCALLYVLVGCSLHRRVSSTTVVLTTVKVDHSVKVYRDLQRPILFNLQGPTVSKHSLQVRS